MGPSIYGAFTFRVQDDGGITNGGIDRDPIARTLTIDVTPVNDAPVAADAAATILEDNALVIDLRNSASDVDNDVAALVGSIVAGPQYGSLALNADGTFTYTPNANFNGTDTFTYKVNDGQLDSNIATVTVNVTSVNDAPQGADNTVTTLEDTPYVFQVADFGFSDPNDLVPNNFLAVSIDTLPLAGSLTLNGQAVTAGQSISVADISAGLLIFAPSANENGPGYASLAFTVQDDGGIANGGVDRDPTSRALTIDVTPVNDAPVATSGTVSTLEDVPYVFTWSDFHITDVDGPSLSVVLDSLPTDGLLQYYNGVDWAAATLGQVITQADIDAGLLCFGPEANAAGFSGYSTPGIGNLKQDYAQFAYQASDGSLLSDIATLTVDVTPVADLPTVTFTDTGVGATAERFRTSWETACNRNPVFTILPTSQLEGWQVVRETGDTGQEAFVIWSSGDKMKDANNCNQVVYAAPGNGQNWLELGDAMGLGHQTWGIERAIDTRAGVTYNLSFDYAGRLGYGIDYTQLGIYVDGTRIGGYANTSPNTALNWQNVSFQFTGTGTTQTICIVTEATSSQSNGRGAMIDDIVLTEEMPTNTGYQDSPINLSAITGALTDTDGSETLSITVGAIPVGATLTDGTQSFTATAALSTVDVTTWLLNNLSITPPAGYTGSFDLAVTATATETATGGSASRTVPLTVTVVPTTVTSPIVLDVDGDGIHTVSLEDSQGRFDLLNTGNAIRSGWISQGDAFLAVDSNGNGIIDDRSELFGGAIGEGFAKLATFDTNQDGRVDPTDARFGALRLWRDRNGNHRTEAGELGTLDQFGITSLNVPYTIKPEEQDGNWLVERSTAKRNDGTTVVMADADFEMAPAVQDDRAARITVRSESAKPKIPVFPTNGVPILLDLASIDAKADAAKGVSPNIDWTPIQSTVGDHDEAKKGHERDNEWLTDFIGAGSGNDESARGTWTLQIGPSEGVRREHPRDDS